MEPVMADAISNPIWSLCLAAMPLVRPDDLWRAWSLAPATLLPLLAFLIVYALGWRRRSFDGKHFELAMTGAGLGLLVLALVSPLCRLAAVLASAHMVQHVVLAALAPPLVMLGAPQRALRSAFRIQHADSAPRTRRWPLLGTLLYGALIWFWHVPEFYEAALTNTTWHLAFLVSLLTASFWFWGLVVTAPKEEFGTTALLLAATMVHTGFLGALLSFASRPLYPLMSSGAVAWGLSPVQDQQLAGLIMWVPMGAVYLLAGLIVVGRGLGPEHSGGRVQA